MINIELNSKKKKNDQYEIVYLLFFIVLYKTINIELNLFSVCFQY